MAANNHMLWRFSGRAVSFVFQCSGFGIQCQIGGGHYHSVGLTIMICSAFILAKPGIFLTENQDRGACAMYKEWRGSVTLPRNIGSVKLERNLDAI